MKKIDMEYLPIWRRYLDWFQISKLSHKALGELLIAMMQYQFEGKEPEKLSSKQTVLWAIIRQDLDFARQKYETSVNNGKKGGRKKAKKEPDKTQNNLTEGKSITESKSESKSISISKTNTETDQDHGGVPAGQEDLSIEEKSYGEYGWVKLTQQQYRELEQEMGTSELLGCIRYIDEAAQSTNNRNDWKDWHLLLRRCHQKNWHTVKSNGYSGKEIPMGASGHLGEAELEAIARVMQS